MLTENSSKSPSKSPVRSTKPYRLARLPRPAKAKQATRPERRIQRSEFAAEALQLALNGAARRSRLDAVVIADDFGMLISSSETPMDLEMLAAVTPIVARGRARKSAQECSGGEIHEDLSVETIRILDEKLHIAGVGGESVSREQAIRLGASAAARILSA